MNYIRYAVSFNLIIWHIFWSILRLKGLNLISVVEWKWNWELLLISFKHFVSCGNFTAEAIVVQVLEENEMSCLDLLHANTDDVILTKRSKDWNECTFSNFYFDYIVVNLIYAPDRKLIKNVYYSCSCMSKLLGQEQI